MHFWSERPENFAHFNGGKFCLCIIDVQSACASVKTGGRMYDKEMALYNAADNYTLNPKFKVWPKHIYLPHLVQTFQISLIYAFILGVRVSW